MLEGTKGTPEYEFIMNKLLDENYKHQDEDDKAEPLTDRKPRELTVVKADSVNSIYSSDGPQPLPTKKEEEVTM